MTARNVRILLTGSTGQVGEALTRTLAPLGELYAPTRTELDLADPASIRAAVRAFRPTWIVNPAAHTAVDKAESEPDLARALNATAPAILAEEAAALNAVLIHFSTDYVFDGTKPTPYVETDPTHPLSVYGSTKLAGEQATVSCTAAHIILRTSWVYGTTGKNFLRTILRLARERDHLRIVADQHGAPTWSFDLARLSAHIIARTENQSALTGRSPAALAQDLTGIYHAAGAGETTWAGFASAAIARLHSVYPDAVLARIEPIATADYPTPAHRPANSRLDCTRLTRTFDYRMMPWQDSLTAVMTELGAL